MITTKYLVFRGQDTRAKIRKAEISHGDSTFEFTGMVMQVLGALQLMGEWAYVGMISIAGAGREHFRDGRCRALVWSVSRS